MFFWECIRDSALLFGNLWKTQGVCSVVMIFVIVVQRRAHEEVDEEDLEEAEVEEEHLDEEKMEEELMIC